MGRSLQALTIGAYLLGANAFISSSISPVSLVQHRNAQLLSLQSKLTSKHSQALVGRRGALSPVSPLLAIPASESNREVSKSEEPGWMPTKTELKKLLPLGLMFFCILFNYTILRDTKDVSEINYQNACESFYHFLTSFENIGSCGYCSRIWR